MAVVKRDHGWTPLLDYKRRVDPSMAAPTVDPLHGPLVLAVLRFAAERGGSLRSPRRQRQSVNVEGAVRLIRRAFLQNWPVCPLALLTRQCFAWQMNNPIAVGLPQIVAVAAVLAVADILAVPDLIEAVPIMDGPTTRRGCCISVIASGLLDSLHPIYLPLHLGRASLHRARKDRMETSPRHQATAK